MEKNVEDWERQARQVIKRSDSLIGDLIEFLRAARRAAPEGLVDEEMAAALVTQKLVNNFEADDILYIAALGVVRLEQAQKD